MVRVGKGEREEEELRQDASNGSALYAGYYDTIRREQFGLSQPVEVSCGGVDG
jgi:hypothetical protein